MKNNNGAIGSLFDEPAAPGGELPPEPQKNIAVTSDEMERLFGAQEADALALDAKTVQWSLTGVLDVPTWARGYNIETLADAVDFVNSNLEKGHRCPCCQQYARIWKRSIGRTMALEFLRLCRLSYDAPGEFFHIRQFNVLGGDFCKLAYWELIEPLVEDGRTRGGFWRVTAKGWEFARGVLRLPSVVFLYNNVCLGMSATETVTISDALKTAFDFDVLMNSEVKLEDVVSVREAMKVSEAKND